MLMLFFVSIRMKLSFLSYDLFLSLYCMCVSGIMMCCSVVKSWTAGLRTCLCQVSSGCLDFSTPNPSSLVMHIPAYTKACSLHLFYSCLTPCLSGFPAVMQSLARKNEWPLDKVNLTVDVTKKFKEEFNQPAREGAYVYGLYMEGRKTILLFLSIVGQQGRPLFQLLILE